MTQPRGKDIEPPQDPLDGYDPSLDSHYSSSSSNADASPRRRRVPRDNLKDFRIEVPEFDGSLKPKDYVEWVQPIERIIEIKVYS